MKTENVKQVIQELAKQNFNLYPDQTTTSAQDVAIGYWDTRTELEIERDEELSITKIDYVNWVMAEFEIFIQKV